MKRTKGLNSVKGATFGWTRTNADGSPKIHQGIDLEAEPGTELMSPGASEVVAVSKDPSGYGLGVTIKTSDNIFLFFAHLSKIIYNVGYKLKDGQVFAHSGSTGNASKMTSVAKGAHVHIEVRNIIHPRRGLLDRVNPQKFFTLDN